MECPLFKLLSPVSVVPFHLPVLGRMKEGCPLRGTPGPTSSLVHLLLAPYTQHKLRASSLPTLCSLPMLCLPCSPSPIRGPCLPEGRGLTGWGPSGGPGGGEGRRRSVTSCRCPLGRGPRRRRRGCLAGTFLSFISRFFLYLNLQICIIQGQPIKEEYNGGHWEIKVCV